MRCLVRLEAVPLSGVDVILTVTARLCFASTLRAALLTLNVRVRRPLVLAVLLVRATVLSFFPSRTVALTLTAPRPGRATVAVPVPLLLAKMLIVKTLDGRGVPVGGAGSVYVTVSWALVAAPPSFVETTVSVFGPGLRVTGADHEPSPARQRRGD